MEKDKINIKLQRAIGLLEGLKGGLSYEDFNKVGCINIIDEVISLLEDDVSQYVDPRSLEGHVAFSNENGDSYTEIIELKSMPSNQIDLEDMIADIKLKGK